MEANSEDLELIQSKNTSNLVAFIVALVLEFVPFLIFLLFFKAVDQYESSGILFLSLTPIVLPFAYIWIFSVIVAMLVYLAVSIKNWKVLNRKRKIWFKIYIAQLVLIILYIIDQKYF